MASGPLQAVEEERARRFQELAARAETAQRRLEFLAEAGAVLTASLDYETTLASVARLAVPFLADWCAVDVVNEAGEIRRREVFHADPAKMAWLRKLQGAYSPSPNLSCGAPNVVRTGASELYPEITDEMLTTALGDAGPAWISRSLAARSAVIVPLRAHGRILGAITLVLSDSDRRYTPTDLALAEELAHRAALAADNAALYAAEQRVRQAMQRVADQLDRLQQVTAALSEALTSAQVADVILHQGLEALEANAGVVAALTEDGSRLLRLGIVGYSPEAAATWENVPVDALLPIAEAVRTGEALVIETREERDARYPHLTGVRAIGGDGALVALPLLFHGRAVGGIRLSFPEDRTFSREDRAFLGTLAELCAQALERARLYDAARESEERFTRIFRSSPVVTSIATLPEERFIDVNDGFLRALGFRREEVIGRTACELGLWADPRERQDVIDALLAGRSMHNRELRCRTRSGAVRKTLTSMEVIELDGAPCVLALGLDITEREPTEGTEEHA